MVAQLGTLDRRRWIYHIAVLALGLAVAALAVVRVVQDGSLDVHSLVVALIAVPIVVVVARFPMVLESGSGGIEVGFDSSILMFLLCTLGPAQAVAAWALGVVITQATAMKRPSAKVFNIGVGFTAAGLAAAVYEVTRAGEFSTPRELLAVTLAAASYFVADYVLSALSVAIGAGSPLHRHLMQPGTLFAIACFVPFDWLGYLGAVVEREAPWWTVSLLAVPLVTLLVATRAVSRGRENARRLSVLFDAAVQAQTLVDRTAVEEALVGGASRLLLLRGVSVRASPPGRGEIGTKVDLGDGARWLVARSLNRARASVAGDEQALRTLAAVASDAVARLALTDEMVHVARHDPLTDLPNRGILLDRLTDALARLEPGQRVGLLFIDLDGFKPVNDRFGHSAGDRVLVQLADRLRAAVRDGDTIARLGGDEFAILVEDVHGVDVGALCRRVLAAVKEGVQLDGHHVRLSASVGVAGGTGEDTATGLLRNADLAMYQAKAGGPGRYVVYEPALGRARLDRLELVDDLRRALDHGEIEVVYQPLVAVADERIVGVEALARWRRGEVPVPPDVFIAAAEENGLIGALGRLVLARVAADGPALCDAAGRCLSVNVNISATQLRDRGFIGDVRRAVAEMGETALVLEITERQGVDLAGGVLDAMRELAGMGVAFAIDDFGVGFSSISYLRDLPAQIIKADAALSADVDRDERARALLRSVVLMGRTLGFEVVIEGIERRSQLDVVREDAPEALAQGYLLHRPTPLAQMIEMLRTEGAVAS